VGGPTSRLTPAVRQDCQIPRTHPRRGRWSDILALQPGGA
jgi:hypothetical protein